MKLSNKKKLIDYGVFTVLLLTVSAITLTLFYRQCTGSPELYHSDMKAYILEMQGLDSGYSFPYPIFFKLSAFFNLFTTPEWAVAIATMVLNSASMVIAKLVFNKITLERLETSMEKAPWVAGILLSFATLGLFFVSMLYPPTGIYLPGIKYRYLGVFTANPFHNATYMAARPFTMLAFFWYVKLLDEYEKGADKRDYILFSLFLLLATMTKPSFTIVLLGAAGLIILYRMFRTKFENFKPTIILGLCFIPTFLDLLYQYKGVFVPDEGAEGGMGFCFGDVWSLYCDNIPLAIGIGVGFPMLVLVCNWKELRTNTLFRFSWQLFGMGFLMAFFLYEKGFREPDFNFSWGYMCGIFFAFVGALEVLLKETAKKRRPVLLVAQWLAYLWHIVCGLYYFMGIFKGGMYY